MASSSTGDRLLYLLKSRGPRTAGEAGAALSMTAAGAGQWLARLAGAGLVAAEDRRHGRGRPRRYWALTPKGHARFPNRHADLALEMLEAAGAVFGDAGLEKLIAYREAMQLKRYAAALGGCGSLGERVATLAALRDAEGYMATCEPLGRGAFLLAENHCPIGAAAKACQGLCRSELDVLREALGEGVEVERVEHTLAGCWRCAYEIRRTRGKPRDVASMKRKAR